MKYDRAAHDEAARLAMETWRAREPVTLLEWAEKHFVRSKGVDYTSGKWESWPFQRGILAAMGDDRIEEISFQKSARLGWSAMVRAAIGYYQEHKRRDMAVWSPTDSDRDKFSKKAVDSLLRDVDCMAEVMPNAVSRHKDNTLELKSFIASTLHLLGGKASKNYRDISVSVCILEEVEAFDPNIEGEGSPFKLAAKRNEGATFRKTIAGSTPRKKATSLIAPRCAFAKVRYRFRIPCPECSEFHELTWLVDDDKAQQTHGLRWEEGKPSTVRHLCPHCGCLIDQGQYLEAAPLGKWFGDDGTTLDTDGEFRNSENEKIDPQRHVAFYCWSAYSPSVSWPAIVEEYEEAMAKLAEGDDTLLITFTNTTRGETYAGQVDSTDADDLKERAEPFSLALLPNDCLVLLAGADTQDNRVEVGVWGFGRGSQMWTIDHRVFYGDPGGFELWKEVGDWYRDAQYQHVAGTEVKISGMAIDSGGHYTADVYEFARKNKHRDVYAIKGRNANERAIKDGATVVDYDYHGKKRPKGVLLWMVGTNKAKDRLYGRLQTKRPGPGYIHLSNELGLAWFRQFASESRITLPSGLQRWAPPHPGVRGEALDCAVYALWLEEHMELRRKSESWWRDLEQRIRPAPIEAMAPVETVVVQASVKGKYSMASSFYGARR